MKKIIILLLFLFTAMSGFSQTQNGINWGRYFISGSLAVGKQISSTSNPLAYADTSSYFDIGGDTVKRGIRFPRGYKDSIFSPKKGLYIHDLATNRPVFYNGSAWRQIFSGEDTSSQTFITTDSILMVGANSYLYNRGFSALMTLAVGTTASGGATLNVAGLSKFTTQNSTTGTLGFQITNLAGDNIMAGYNGGRTSFGYNNVTAPTHQMELINTDANATTFMSSNLSSTGAGRILARNDGAGGVDMVSNGTTRAMAFFGITTTNINYIKSTTAAGFYVGTSDAQVFGIASNNVIRTVWNNGTITHTGDFVPGANNTYALGTSSVQFLNVFSSAFTGNTDAKLVSGASNNLQLIGGSTVNAQVFGTTGDAVFQHGGVFTDAGYGVDILGTLRCTGVVTFTPTLTGSGSAQAMSLGPTINMSGSADYTVEFINVTETATGSGAHLLVDYRVAGISKYSISTLGNVVNAGTINTTGNILAPAVQNSSSTNNALVSFNTTGVVASRSVADANPAFTASILSATSTAPVISMTNTANTATAGTIRILSITPSYNQASGNAANTDIFLNRTQTLVGSGTQLLMDLQVGGVSQFNVTNGGAGTFTAGVTGTTWTGAGAIQSATTATNANFWVRAAQSTGTYTAAQYLFAGATTIYGRNAFYGSTSSPMTTVGSAYASVIFASAPVTTSASGTNPLLVNIAVLPLGTVTSGGSTTTTTASLYIMSAGSGGTNNYAVQIASGTLALAAGSTTSGTQPLWFPSGGSLNTTAAGGSVEYNGAFYMTKNSGLRIGPGGCIYDAYTDANNSGTAETDLYSYTTPASTLAVDGSKVTASYVGTFNDITATTQLQIYFASTVIGNTGVLTVSSTGAWTAEVKIVRTSSTTARASVNISTPGASTAVYTSETDLTGLTLTGTNILKITGTAGGASGGSNDITGKFATANWLPVAAN